MEDKKFVRTIVLNDREIELADGDMVSPETLTEHLQMAENKDGDTQTK